MSIITNYRSSIFSTLIFNTFFLFHFFFWLSEKPKKFQVRVDSLVFNKNLNKMIGNFSWNASIDQENILYIVSWQAPGDLSQPNILMAGKAETLYPSITLSLEPSLIYKLEVRTYICYFCFIYILL